MQYSCDKPEVELITGEKYLRHVNFPNSFKITTVFPLKIDFMSWMLEYLIASLILGSDSNEIDKIHNIYFGTTCITTCIIVSDTL